MSIFKVRDYIEGDRNFVFDTWLNGLYFGNDWFKEIPSHIYFKEYQKVIDKIVSREDVKILVACLVQDEEVALGYCAFDDERVHWIFVKDSWRKMGIAKSLFPPKIKVCSHLSKIGRTLRIKHGLIFNPFL